MSTSFPSQARAVVIGCGIVGNSLAFHLTRLGWGDVVQIDKGPLPNPGGSTGHASNFIFPVDHSKEMTALTAESVRQYRELDVFTECGGIEVARTEARMQELRRRMASAKAWGIEPASLVTPAEIKRLVPFIDESILLGGFSTPGVGVVDSLRAGTLMRERAQGAGALHVHANTELLGIVVEHGRVRGVRTTRGEIAAETVVIACGVWSPLIARMAGARIPLTPAVHQMIDIGPVPRFATSSRAIEYPIVRDMDTFMYERQDGGGLEIGSYAHRPILHDPEEIPSIEEAALSPTEFPFTQADFELQMEHALELMPEIVGDESVGVKYAINGLIALTPDGMPILGETPEVRGLWSVAAVWVKEGPGVGKSVAEWMVHGESEIDLHSSDIARFHAHQTTRAHVRARTGEAFNKTYGIVHPSEQWASDQRSAALADARAPPGARRGVLRGGGLGTTAVVRVQRAAARGVRRSCDAPRGGVGVALVVADHQRRAPRDARARRGLRPLGVRDLRHLGPGRAGLAAAGGDAPDGRAGRARRLHPAAQPGGGFRSDLTIMRLGDELFRVVTGGAHGMSDRKWFRRQSAGRRLGAARTTSRPPGPRSGSGAPAPATVLSSVTADDVSAEGFRFGWCKELEIGSQRVLASRISYVGDLGWELYVPIEQGATPLGHGLGGGRAAPAGALRHRRLRHDRPAREVLPRLRRRARKRSTRSSRRAWRDRGSRSEDFIGKRAHIGHLAEEPAAILCTLTVDDHASASGTRRYMMGREPILTRDGAAVDGCQGSPLLRDERRRRAVRRPAHPARLPAARARARGAELAVEYMCERYPVTVAVAGSTPLFDPENTRIRS